MTAQAPPNQPGVFQERIERTVISPAPPATAQRPILVALISIIVLLAGIVWMVVGATSLFGLSITHYLGSVPTFVDLTGQTSAVLEIVIGLAVVVISFGLWEEKQWALILTLLFLLFELIAYGSAYDFVSFPFILSLLLFVALIASSRSFH